MPTNQTPETRLLSAVKGQLDDLIVQLSLGRAEAIDYLESQKQALTERLHLARASLQNDPRRADLLRKLDHLRVQLALGRLESRDAYVEQREKIRQAIDDIRGEWHHLDEAVRGELAEKAEALQSGLNTLALNLGLAAVIAEDEMKVRKEEISRQAGRLAEKLKQAGQRDRDELVGLADEARRSWDDLKDNLGRLLR